MSASRTETAAETPRVQSLERGIDILMALAHGPRSLTQVAEATGLSKATTHRLLGGLGHESLVLRHPTEALYLLGPGVLRLVQEATQGVGSFAAYARPAMVALRDLSEESITLHIRIGHERMCVEELPSPQPLRYTAGVGSTAPLHVGAAGKALLAFDDPAETERTLRVLPLEALTSATIVNPHALREELEQVRRQGWAASEGERVQGAGAISVPVFSHGRMISVMSLLAPADRLDAGRREELLPALRGAALDFQRAIEMAGADEVGPRPRRRSR